MKKGLKVRLISLVMIGILASPTTLLGCGKTSVEQPNAVEEATGKLETESVTEKREELETTSEIDGKNEEKDEEIHLAEEELKKKEEEVRKAEEELKKKEEEARKAEEDLKKQEEARKAEEELKKKEEEARKAEEELRQKAEEERQKAEREREIKNSFSMMYYLAFTAENIRASKDNRLMLDDIYTSLLNDINPGAIDEITQDHLENLRDIIKQYISISTKRERLQFIYNQNKAQAMRSAVPNPLAVLSVAQSLDWKKLAITAVYTVVDSYNSYKKASENADTEFLMSGWDLDDEELATVQKNRDRAFDYMVDMVQEYKLDGLKTFSEKDVAKYTDICTNIESPAEKIQRLKAKEEQYELFGDYWLELANCYFELDKYKECLDCVEKYNALSIEIYKVDSNLVQVLPKAIVAAQNICKNGEYESTIARYADAIMANTSTEDWSTRYFAAQVYLDLYAKTNKKTYLDKAYGIAIDNVAVLLNGQRDLNNTYVNDVKEEEVKEPDYRYLSEEEKKEKEQEYKEEKKRVKKYNKNLKEARKTELPSMYEPLVLNCELLFALADKKNISNTEKKDIETLLQCNSNGIFIVVPINDMYSFTRGGNKYQIELTKDEISMPASMLTAGAKLEIVVTDNGVSTTIDDCKVGKVERKGDKVDEYVVHISSKKWDKYVWSENSRITVIITYADVYDKQLSLKYKVSNFEEHWYGDKVVFGEE